MEDTFQGFDVSECPSVVLVVRSCDALLFSRVRTVGHEFAFLVVKVL